MKTTLTALAFLTLGIPFIVPLAHGQQHAHKVKLKSEIELQYLLYLPEDYEAELQRHYPLLLFLHGGGESGRDVEKVKTHGPPKLIDQGGQFGFIVLSPQNPDKRRFWNETTLISLLDHIEQTYRVDKQRVYIAGLSRGGYGAWRMAIQYPQRFAALIAICGVAPSNYAKWLDDMPIWVFHGAADRTIPVSESDEMVEALRKNGNPVRYTRYESTGHDAWTATFENPELYEWMLNQKNED